MEYAKGAPNDILVRITVENRGPEAAPVHVLPTLWFRNTWSWEPGAPKPRLVRESGALLSPGDFYGAAGSEHVRVAVVQPDDRIDLVARRLGIAI